MPKSLRNAPIDILKSTIVNDVEFDYEDDEDADLIKMVEERIKNDNGVRYTWEEVKRDLGITDEDLQGWEDVEIE